MKKRSVLASMLTAVMLATSLPTIAAAVPPNPNPNKGHQEVQGIVKTYDSSQLVIVTKSGEEKTYTITAGIPVKDKNNLGIKPGSRVEVELDASGNPSELEIKSDQPDKKVKAPKKIEVKGVVKAYDGSQLLIITKSGEEKTYTITASIPVEDKNNLGIKPGSQVEIELDVSGSPTKLEIKSDQPDRKTKEPKKNQVKG